MADNVRISTADGVLSFATDEVNGLHYFRQKPVFGADGSVDGDVQLASTTVLGPLPVNNYHASDYVMVAGLGIAVEFGVINQTATATLETPASGRKIRILSMYCEFETVTGDEIYVFKSGAAGTSITGELGTRYAAANAGGFDLSLPFNPTGWFETATSALLELNVVAGTSPIAHGFYSFIQV